jgi:hypothetical protein
MNESKQAFEILPCPFCGKPPRAAMKDRAAITCLTDNCLGPRTSADYLVDAIAMWNTRSPAPQGDGRALEPGPYSGAWRPITKDDAQTLIAKGEKVDWIEGAGYIVYDAQALTETQAQAAALSAPPSVALEAREAAIKECELIAEANKLHWASKVDPCKPDDPSRDVYRAKSAACFQIEMDIRTLTRPQPGGAVAGTERGEG